MAGNSFLSKLDSIEYFQRPESGLRGGRRREWRKKTKGKEMNRKNKRRERGKGGEDQERKGWHGKLRRKRVEKRRRA